MDGKVVEPDDALIVARRKVYDLSARSPTAACGRQHGRKIVVKTGNHILDIDAVVAAQPDFAVIPEADYGNAVPMDVDPELVPQMLGHELPGVEGEASSQVEHYPWVEYVDHHSGVTAGTWPVLENTDCRAY
jgi:hypothetical protein